MKIILVLVLFFISSICFADAKTEKVDSLIKIMHLDEYFREQMEVARVEYEKSANASGSLLFANFSPSPEYRRLLDESHEKLIKGLGNNFTKTDDYIKVVGKYYNDHYSVEELDGLIKFYSSSVGQKQLWVNHEVDQKVVSEYFEVRKSNTAEILKNYRNSVIKILSDCHCYSKNNSGN